MAVFTIGDLHLSLGADKRMDVFPGWENYVERIERHWRETVSGEDTVVLAGDLSWGMTLEASLPDFLFLERLPGRKLLIKGNHDYWWSTGAKMQDFFQRHGLSTLSLLHNNAYACEGAVLCGSRGWLFEKGEPHDRKILLREAMRLELSLKEGGKHEGERIVFLHYPPLYGEEVSPEIIEVLQRFGVRRCYYGHIHSAGCARAVCGPFDGIGFQLISADFLRFRPLRVETNGTGSAG
ncbi:MAG: serine/threonine protein phosphatase [Provencibacterium sp.]|jgi:predicted phosphohydrolase|nr:serine/threonine protein phosphatase [Provencibacterium sp.]